MESSSEGASSSEQPSNKAIDHGHKDDGEAFINDDFMIQIGSKIPGLEECYHFVAADPSCGAVSTFVGITRDNFQDKHVLSLSYEAYVPMAIKEMKKLCLESKTKYQGIRRIAAVHVTGDCPVGQASVILACSSPHRMDSIKCCEYLINELKARIPIWKKEIYSNDPNAVWKENIEWFDRINDDRKDDSGIIQQHSLDESSQLGSRRVMKLQSGNDE